jgi:hypothetical protein
MPVMLVWTDKLTEMISAVGYEADYQSIAEEGWKDALDEPCDFIVAAGRWDNSQDRPKVNRSTNSHCATANGHRQ